MSSQQQKLALLTVLLLVMAYVWWPSQGERSDVPSRTLDSSSSSARSTSKQRTEVQSVSIQYRIPRVNPFEPERNQASPAKRSAQPTTAQVPIPNLKLLGITIARERAQAILQLEDGSTVVSGVSDSIQGWKIIAIQKSSVVLAHGTARDTLHVAEY